MRSSDGVITRPMMNSYGSNIVITNIKGKTVSSFTVQNHRICFLRYKPTEDTILPVEVITFDQARQALDLAKLRNQIFLVSISWRAWPWWYGTPWESGAKPPEYSKNPVGHPTGFF